MSLPLQLTVNSAGSALTNKIKEAYAYFYGQLGMAAPTIISCKNPLIYYRTLRLLADDALVAEEQHPELRTRGKKIDSLLWAYINKNVAKPLASAAKPTMAVLPFMRKISVRQMAVVQALQGHLIKQKGMQNLIESAHHPNFLDQQWANYHYQQVAKNEGLEQLLHLLHSGLMMATHFKNAVLWCPLPNSVSLNEMDQLHNQDGPSMVWPAFKLYHWNGVEIPAHLIENPSQVTRQEVMQQRNAEVRRCYQEILGAERFAALFDLEKLDQNRDRQGHSQVLYRTAHVDDLAKDHLYFAQVLCPSTHRIYFLCVPPHISTISQAVAWTFGKTPDTYNPDSET